MAGDSGTIFIYVSIWMSSAQHNLQWLKQVTYVYIFEIKFNL